MSNAKDGSVLDASRIGGALEAVRKGLRKAVRCSSCSATYSVARSETRPFICAACGAIVDTDPWRKIMRVLT